MTLFVFFSKSNCNRQGKSAVRRSRLQIFAEDVEFEEIKIEKYEETKGILQGLQVQGEKTERAGVAV